MFLIRLIKHLWALIAYRHLSFEEAREKFTRWVESSRPQYTKDYKFRVLGTGFMYKSCGAFGDVFISPCGRFALKRSQDAGCDEGYSHFLQLALKRQDNPYYPRIYAHLQDDCTQVVLMERLRPLASTQYLWVKKLRQHMTTDMATLALKDENYQQLVADLQALFASTKRIQCDIHHSNVMRRGEQLVVTDPAS